MTILFRILAAAVAVGLAVFGVILIMAGATEVFGQQLGAPMPFVQPQFFSTSSGVACAGCQLFSYAAGTTTPLATYTDGTLATPNTNPVVLNTLGRPSGSGGIWLLPQAYKFVLQTALGVTVWTQDNIYDFGELTLGSATSVNCANQSGANYSNKMTACANALPSTGGTADARALQGTQTWNSDAFSGITKPVDYVCGASTITVSTTSTIPSNVHVIRDEGCSFVPNAGITFTVNGPMDGSATDGSAFCSTANGGVCAMGSPYYIFNSPLNPKGFQTTNLGWLGIGTNGGTVSAPISAINNVNVGDSNAAHFDSTMGCPYIDVGSIANNGGLIYFRGLNAACGGVNAPRMELGLHNFPVTVMMTTSGLGVMTTDRPLSPLHVHTGTNENFRLDNSGGTLMVQAVNDAANAINGLIINGNPVTVQANGTVAGTFLTNGGNGSLIVNGTSTDFASGILVSEGTFAVVGGATPSHDAKVITMSASGGDGKSQINVTHTGVGVTQPMEFFSDNALMVTLSATSSTLFNQIFMPNLSQEGGTQDAVCTVFATREIQYNTAATCTVSSLRFKDWLGDLSCKEARRIIKEAKPGKFQDKDGHDSPRFGFAAEDMAKLEPRLVYYEHDGKTPRAIDYERYTAILTRYLQCQ